MTDKDEAKLLELIDPNIRTSFGDDGGVDAFRSSWKTSSTDSLLWTELAKILSLGGSFRTAGDQRSFWAPYVYAEWPESIAPFEHVAAVRPDVAIRSSARSDAPIVTTVDWAILERIPDAGQTSNRDWLHVKSRDGHEGWANASDVHSPVGYRAGFSNRSGRWKMEALVAGD